MNVEIDRVASDLHSACIRLLRALRLGDGAAALSAPRLSILSVLNFSGPCSITTLSRAEQVKAPSMTRLIQMLEKDGLVERASNPNDKRGQLISITTAGRKRFSLAQQERLRALTSAIAALPVEDQASLETLAALLKRIPDEIGKEKGRPD